MAKSGTLDDALAAAVADRQAGRYGDAAARFDAILAQAPDWLLALVRYAELCEQQGDLARAHELWERAAARAPNNAGVQTNLAKLRRQQGEPDGAIAAASAALAAQPGQAAARFNRALAARDAGYYGDAAADLDRLLADHPGQAAFLAERGRLALALDDPAGARDWLEQARAAGAGDLDSALNLARARTRLGETDGALDALAAVAGEGAQDPDWQSQRGFALAAQGAAAEAEAAFGEAVRLGSRQLWPQIWLAYYQNKRGAGKAAEATLNAALAWIESGPADDPAQRADMAKLYNDLGVIQQKRGRYRTALDYFSTALSRNPGDLEAHGNYLLSLHYDPDQTAESLYRAHRNWRDRHVAELEASQAPLPARPRANKPLRVGILGAKLRGGPILLLGLAGLEHLDPAEIELTVYDMGSRADGFNGRLRRCAARWRDVAQESNAAIAERIRADQLDILVNLMGHAEGRLDICAHKPAPVQVQWGGYNTSGLDAMDWFLGDPVECPPGSDAYFTETVYRLPDDYIVYALPEADLGPGPLPARTRGAVTFGCFNNPAKVSPPIATLWRRILEAVPGSRLVMKRGAFDDPEAVASVRAVLEEAGIPGERVELRGGGAHHAMLTAYQEVDIALDPWPYTGGVTTLEALWMGVPTVTLPGPSFVGRHGASHLANAGNGDWIAADGDAYVNLAVRWAHDWDALAQLRGQLRDRLASSPVCDGPRFARNLEAALQDMWRRSTAGAGEGA